MFCTRIHQRLTRDRSLTVEDGTGTLWRNVGSQLRTYAAQYSRRAKTQSWVLFGSRFVIAESSRGVQWWKAGSTNSSYTRAVKTNPLKSGNRKQSLKLITASGKELKNSTKQKSWVFFFSRWKWRVCSLFWTKWPCPSKSRPWKIFTVHI
jgi:hypothetical protein